MFDNIGRKMQNLAKFCCIMGIIAASITGLILIINSNGFAGALIGIIVTAVAILFAWIGSWFLYGFGSIIENSQKKREYMDQIEKAAADIEDEPAASSQYSGAFMDLPEEQ